jgi:hypothetical protein
MRALKKMNLVWRPEGWGRTASHMWNVTAMAFIGQRLAAGDHTRAAGYTLESDEIA